MKETKPAILMEQLVGDLRRRLFLFFLVLWVWFPHVCQAIARQGSPRCSVG